VALALDVDVRLGKLRAKLKEIVLETTLWGILPGQERDAQWLAPVAPSSRSLLASWVYRSAILLFFTAMASARLRILFVRERHSFEHAFQRRQRGAAGRRPHRPSTVAAIFRASCFWWLAMKSSVLDVTFSVTRSSPKCAAK